MRRALLLLVIGAALAGCSAASNPATPTTPLSYKSTILADHPVAYWRLDEASGTAMVDATGNGNDGAYAGAVTLGQPGALASDGDTAVGFDPAGGEASVASTTSLQVNPVTIELWINKRTDAEYGAYVSKNFAPGAGGGTGWFQLLNDHHNGRLEFRVTEDNPTLVSSKILDLHIWYYVVATYDGTTAKLFIDGKLDSSVAIAATAKQTADPLYIGRRADGLFNDAVLDEIAIYPTALSSNRIAAHWRAASATH